MTLKGKKHLSSGSLCTKIATLISKSKCKRPASVWNIINIPLKRTYIPLDDMNWEQCAVIKFSRGTIVMV